MQDLKSILKKREKEKKYNNKEAENRIRNKKIGTIKYLYVE